MKFIMQSGDNPPHSTIIESSITCTKSAVGVIVLVRIQLVVVLIELAVKVPRLTFNTAGGIQRFNIHKLIPKIFFNRLTDMCPSSCTEDRTAWPRLCKAPCSICKESQVLSFQRNSSADAVAADLRCHLHRNIDPNNRYLDIDFGIRLSTPRSCC